ncbi:hypothetical protein LNKW23_25120 [Paralimibaculum aggregatum]|uniref:DUF4177 domain-containing protein n=1 Tax=Paralimibaculum aggregatum TaxID=3036245 RepID=A0ABQ6LJ67_9RHOB|nr:hypothetical protein [Limibaculum sp. NKW23]GMG83299.1 hypothetical protein LNKW23_25120 [Limibaculum sp. NKW23]
MEYEYKAVGGPDRGKNRRGCKTTADRVAVAMQEIIRRESAEGWEYLRTDLVPIEERSSLLSPKRVVHCAVLVFRRPRSRPADSRTELSKKAARIFGMAGKGGKPGKGKPMRAQAAPEALDDMAEARGSQGAGLATGLSTGPGTGHATPPAPQPRSAPSPQELIAESQVPQQAARLQSAPSPAVEAGRPQPEPTRLQPPQAPQPAEPELTQFRAPQVETTRIHTPDQAPRPMPQAAPQSAPQAAPPEETRIAAPEPAPAAQPDRTQIRPPTPEQLQSAMLATHPVFAMAQQTGVTPAPGGQDAPDATTIGAAPPAAPKVQTPAPAQQVTGDMAEDQTQATGLFTRAHNPNGPQGGGRG